MYLWLEVSLGLGGRRKEEGRTLVEYSRLWACADIAYPVTACGK